MITKRIITVLTILEGVLYRTKLFSPDYRYSANFVDSWAIDEVIILDITRKKNQDSDKRFEKFFKTFSKNCFVPISVGGWIRTLDDAKRVFDIGADKIVINTGAFEDKKFISSLAKKYGKQSVTLSIDALEENDKYFVYSNQGKKKENIDPFSWAQICVKEGIGEVLITSINKDGWLQGFDLNLCKQMKDSLNIPVLALGGCGNWNHLFELFKYCDVDGACTQNIYHFTEKSISSAKDFLMKKGIHVRK